MVCTRYNAATTIEAIDIKTINNLEKFKGKNVNINNLTVEDYALESASGAILDNNAKNISETQRKDNYNVYLLCHLYNTYCEIKITNYKAWDWTDVNSDLLHYVDQLTTISITGKMQYSTANWGSKRNVPSIDIDFIEWNHQ